VSQLAHPVSRRSQPQLRQPGKRLPAASLAPFLTCFLGKMLLLSMPRVSNRLLAELRERLGHPVAGDLLWYSIFIPSLRERSCWSWEASFLRKS
jgi:hypothetical protein